MAGPCQGKKKGEGMWDDRDGPKWPAPAKEKKVASSLGSGESQNLAIRKYKQKLVSEYWKVVATMVSHARDDRDMTQSECQAWIQTGLALAPFCGHMMNTSLEWLWPGHWR